jgi:hypothetical protein
MSMYGQKFKIENKNFFMPMYLYWTADGQLCCLAVAYSMCDLAMRLEVGVVTYRGWSWSSYYVDSSLRPQSITSFCKCA